ncbi:MAG: hypothetical protein R3E31_21775 [Chloroflexota bacterium]
MEARRAVGGKTAVALTLRMFPDMQQSAVLAWADADVCLPHALAARIYAQEQHVASEELGYFVTG